MICLSEGKARSLEVIPSSSLPCILLWEPINKCKNKQRQDFRRARKVITRSKATIYRTRSARIQRFASQNFSSFSAARRREIVKTQWEARKRKGREIERRTRCDRWLCFSWLSLELYVYMQKMSLLVGWLKEKDYFATRQPELRT